MPISRAQLLRRALVGGVVIAFGELPELASKIPEAQAAPALARTAIPVSARFEWLEDELLPYTTAELRRAPSESGSFETARDWSRPPNNLVNLTAQRAEWLEPVQGHPPVMGKPNVRAVLFGNPFATDDLLRVSHNGDVYLVTGRHDEFSYDLRHVGHTDADAPLVDPAEELRALAKLLPDPKDEVTPELKQKFHQHALGGRPLSRDEMRSFEQYAQSPDGRKLGYDRW